MERGGGVKRDRDGGEGEVERGRGNKKIEEGVRVRRKVGGKRAVKRKRE